MVYLPLGLRPPGQRAPKGRADRKRAAFVQQRSYSCGDLSPTDPPVTKDYAQERSPHEGAVKERPTAIAREKGIRPSSHLMLSYLCYQT